MAYPVYHPVGGSAIAYCMLFANRLENMISLTFILTRNTGQLNDTKGTQLEINTRTCKYTVVVVV